MRREWATSADPTTSPPSPVTWHVIFWILLSLAINSMAQPSGRFCGILTARSRHRIYFCSSPVICLADALDMIIRFIILTIGLKTSPRKACQLIVLGRSESAIKKGRASILHLKDGPLPEIHAQGHRWPRWLFFTIGTLPAAIKLASFSGTPWTKTWGMMFASSFVVIELIHALARSSVPDCESSSSVPGILGFTMIEWEEPQHAEARSRIATLTEAIEVGDVVIIMMAYLAHVGIVWWAAGNLWFLAMSNDDLLNVSSWIKTFVLLWMLVLLVGGFVLKRFGNLNFPFAQWLGVSFFIMVCLPERSRNSGKILRKFQKISTKTSILIYLYGFFWVCHKLMVLVCKQWPSVGRALTIDNPAWGPREAEYVDGDPAQVLVSKEEGPIQELSWAGLCLFITNVVLCALWYAILYDPTGTVNPSWTDVFG